MANQLTFRFLVPAALLIAALLLAACGGRATESPPPTPLAISSEGTPPDQGPLPTAVPLEKPLKAPDEVPAELKPVWEVWALLNQEHVERANLDSEAFTEAAILGLLDALGDPHTGYVRPESFEIESDDIQGKFEGIGANVSMRRDGKLIIVAPLKGSPAEAAGVRPGDVVLEVDGKSIAGLSLLEAVAKIRGPRGTTATLLILHLGAIDPVVIKVIRDVIPLTSVLVRSQPGDRIAHIRLTSFYGDTAEKLAEAVQEVVDGGAKGLILDVRDNPGGLLSSVVDVTSAFLKDGLVLYEVDGYGRRTDFKVRAGGSATELPMVVLTNEFSASASEILAGALQDYKRATVVGGTTFGKGSVNILRRLSNGGGLYITFARWYTPLGRLIEGNGLKPDIEVVSRDREEAEASQLKKAIEVLESQIQARGSGSASS